MKLASTLLILPLLAVACADPPINVSPGALASATPAAATSAGPGAAASVELPKLEAPESEFNESERSRDPFRSFAEVFRDESKTRTRSQRQVVMSQYAIDELKLIGIVTRAEPAKAMLLDPVGTGHVVQRGQFVGRADVVQAAGRTGASYEINWRVDRIRDGDIVLVREDPSNPDVPSATRVIVLRPEGTQIDGK